MTIPITPISFETNLPGMVLSNVSASVSDLAPPGTRKHDLIVDRNCAVQVELEWDQTGTNPWTDFFMSLANAAWHAKATLRNVDGGAASTQTKTEVYAGGPGPRDLTITFPADTLAEGTYQLFLSCHLKAAAGDHLATTFSAAQGQIIEVFDAALVPG